MDRRRITHDSGPSCRSLPDQAAPAGALRVSLFLPCLLAFTPAHPSFTPDNISLHGTYLPPTQIAAQRILPSLPPTQPRLQDKLHRSRIQHFVSLLFDRPSARDMSRIERWVLAVLWPAAVGALCLAAVDMLGDLKWRDDWRHGSLLAGAYDGIGSGRDGDGGTGSGSESDSGMSRAAGEVLIEAITGVGRWGPQVVGLLAALLTSLIRSGVIRVRWPGTGATVRSSETSGEAEGTVTPETLESESDLNSEDEAEEAL